MAQLSKWERPRFWQATVIAAIPLLLAQILAPLYSSAELGITPWLLLALPWSCVMVLPNVAGLSRLRGKATYLSGLCAVAALGAFAVVIVNREDSSTAGLGFIYLWFGGAVAAAALHAVEWSRNPRREDGAE